MKKLGRVTQKLPDPIDESESRKVHPVSVASRPDKIEERIRQEDMPSRNAITKASSREDALATTRRFFGNNTEVKSATAVPVSTTMSVSQTDTPPTTSVPVAIEHPEPSPVRTFPSNGTPPRPIATATIRPRTLEQRRLVGQIETQSHDDTSSEESDTLEPLVMEGLPDELGPEWRILHPFDIPGVRNLTEDTPPTHRRLAENDTLVELIQTAEYLEDAPSWEQRRFIHCDMEILFIEDVVEVMVEVEEEVGYMKMFQEEMSMDEVGSNFVAMEEKAFHQGVM